MIDNTQRPEVNALLARAEGYTFKPDENNQDSVFSPEGNRIGGVYANPDPLTGWEAYGLTLGSRTASTALEAAVKLAEAHIEANKPKRVERSMEAHHAVLQEGKVIALTVLAGDANTVANVLRDLYALSYEVVQLSEGVDFSFDTDPTK